MSAVAKLQPAQPADREDERHALLTLIHDRSFRRGRFRLSSGAESELYFNLKPTMMSPQGARLCALAFLDLVERERADFVGGLEMGAVPIISALAAVSAMEGRDMKTFFVRKKAKAHGTMDVIEGLGPEESLSGRRVVIADDVATTGSSIMQAIASAREAGATIESAIVLVDRQEGAKERLAAENIRLLSVFTAADFLT